MHPSEESTTPEAKNAETPTVAPATSDTDELRLNTHDTVSDLAPQAAIQPKRTPPYKDVGWRKWL